MARMAALGLIILGVATGFSPLSRLEHLRSCASSHSRCAARMTRISAGSTQDQTAQDKARSKSAPDPAVAITAVGEATAVLPVVSTLIFVFAVESIFQSNFDIAANPADIAVLILLSMAAALSLYTTTFSVLEFYYIKLITAGEVFTEDRSDLSLERAFGSIDTNMNEFLEADEIVGALKKLGISAVTPEDVGRVVSLADLDGDGSINKREFLTMMERINEDPLPAGKRDDDLARTADQLLQHFNGMRNYARNGLWASVMFTLFATTVHSLQQYGVHVYSIVMSLILLMGVGAVPYTVIEFRKFYLPALAKFARRKSPH